MKKALILFIASIVCSNIIAQEKKIRISEKTPVAYSRIEKLSSLTPVERLQFDKEIDSVSYNHLPFLKGSSILSDTKDPVVQTTMGNRVTDSLQISFEGINNTNNKGVPDTDGDVGPDHYIQIVNSSFAIWDKQGNLLFGPVNNITLWDGLGITTQYDFDPIVLYDHLADRWLITDVARGNASTKYYLLIGVSENGDPLDSWNVWAYGFDNLPDYPKYGVWPDGYYVTANFFEYETYNWLGAAVGVFDRVAMQAGETDPALILFNLSASGDDPHLDPFNILPADLDGNPPLEGTPNYLSYFKDDAWGFETDFLSIWECQVNWGIPENSSLQEIQQIATEPFDANLDNFSYITQPITPRKLQSLGNKLMFSLKYRQIGENGMMVTNHTVDVNDNDHAGIRWYELKETDGIWNINQQGTYAPDSVHRWMGSIAMDDLGNIALGYSVSNINTYPSIRYTGRLVDDPLGEMTILEKEIVAGGGYQSQSFGRWGDYSMMTIDPVDNLTFWYTQMYYATSSSQNWSTRIAAFKIASTTSINSDNNINPIGTLKIHPNPLTTSTTIEYELSKPSTVQLTIYDYLGKQIEVIERKQVQGKQQIIWNAEGLPAGVYFCVIKTNQEIQTTKLIKL